MKKLLILALGALGVVYGDIGTSPLYAINEIFFGKEKIVLNLNNILGGISLVIWSLTLIVALKYIVFVLNADNNGEGGVFALYGLLKKKKFFGGSFLMILFIFASGLLFGDGFITPAISVISAIEGLKLATPIFEPYIIPITIIVLTILFSIQSRGTGKIGSVFGPIIIFWFLSIGLLGLNQVLNNPLILKAFNPYYAFNFIFNHDLLTNLSVMGAVMLVITGGEAMYADMGHFGKKPIRIAWFSLVYPSLLLNYLGQGAYLLSKKPVFYGNIFFSLVPKKIIYPMVGLSTMATIIASQALISGVFSLTTQAINLNLLPKMPIKHTNKDHHGQIYVNFINWFLFFGCVSLILIFKSSSALASVYGLAVSGDMIINSLGMFFIAVLYWKWSKLKSFIIFGFFALIEISFLFANSLKIFQGGYIPLLIAIIFALIMIIWNWGTKIKNSIEEFINRKNLLMKDLIEIKKNITKTYTIDRSSIFLSQNFIDDLNDNIPLTLNIFYKRYKQLPKDIVILYVNIDQENPHLQEKRYEIKKFFENGKKGSIFSVKINFGFMEEPNVEEILEDLAKEKELKIDVKHEKWLIHAINKRLLYKKPITLFTRLKFFIYNLLDSFSLKADRYFGLGHEEELTVEVIPVIFSDKNNK